VIIALEFWGFCCLLVLLPRQGRELFFQRRKVIPNDCLDLNINAFVLNGGFIARFYFFKLFAGVFSGDHRYSNPQTL
jgi:hypothetical protein